MNHDQEYATYKIYHRKSDRLARNSIDGGQIIYMLDTGRIKDLKFPKGYKEKENLWLRLYGKHNGKNKQILIECIVGTNKGWEDAGCNIDTGMPASIMAQMIKKEIITEYGSFAPEAIVLPAPFFKELKKRNMIIYENGKKIN